MNYRRLGRTKLCVSEICFGAMTFTGKTGWTHLGTMEQITADKLTSAALDNGINFFDTADIYSNGISEEMLGKALKGRRSQAVITTKCGFAMNDAEDADTHSARKIREACEASLKRLSTDYIDLYLIHSYDFTTPYEEFLSALDSLVKEGKVRYIGASNFFAWQLMKANAVCEMNNWEKFVCLQAYYSLLGRDLEYELVPLCADQGIGIMVWGPLHGGMLTGKYRDKNNWPKDTRIKKPGDALPYDHNKGEKIFNELERISYSRKIPVSRAALAYLLHKPGITSLVTGIRTEQQLMDNIAASSIKLTEDEIYALDEVSKPARIYPYWYFDIFRKEKMNKFFYNLYKKE